MAGRSGPQPNIKRLLHWKRKLSIPGHGRRSPQRVDGSPPDFKEIFLNNQFNKDKRLRIER